MQKHMQEFGPRKPAVPSDPGNLYYQLPTVSSALEGGRCSEKDPAASSTTKHTELFVWEAGWAYGPVWKTSHNRIRSPDCPARDKSDYT